MLVDSCELLVLVKETKKDLGDDTRIEEKGRQLSAAIIGLTVNKTLGYNALMLLKSTLMHARVSCLRYNLSFQHDVGTCSVG